MQLLLAGPAPPVLPHFTLAGGAVPVAERVAALSPSTVGLGVAPAWVRSWGRAGKALQDSRGVGECGVLGSKQAGHAPLFLCRRAFTTLEERASSSLALGNGAGLCWAYLLGQGAWGGRGGAVECGRRALPERVLAADGKDLLNARHDAADG